MNCLPVLEVWTSLARFLADRSSSTGRSATLSTDSNSTSRCSTRSPSCVSPHQLNIQIHRPYELFRQYVRCNCCKCKELVELLHRASFRDGLSNSVFAPAYNVHSLTSQVVEAFRARLFTADRLTLVGVGLPHDQMLQHAESFRLPKAHAPVTRPKSRFIAGTNHRTLHIHKSSSALSLLFVVDSMQPT